MNARMAVLAFGVACAVLTAGCGNADREPEVASVSGSSSAAPPAGGQDEFTKCMKENGVDLDLGGTPDEEGKGSTQGSAGPADQRAQREALEKCRAHLPDGGAPKPLGEEALRQARDFAKCMREKGVDYPDPDPNKGGGEGVTPLPEGLDVDDPATREKMADCSRQTGGVVSGSPR
nr:hypothetical protein GCM10017745_39520 [Saccharothrix mutabilis subsp. capreolus]